MKNEPRPCDTEELRQLLNDCVAEPRHAELVAHLDECEPCRLALGGLAAGGEWWEDARRFVGRPGETGACPNHVLAVGLRSTPVEFRTDNERGTHDEVDLGFLAPSSVPGSLGRRWARATSLVLLGVLAAGAGIQLFYLARTAGPFRLNGNSAASAVGPGTTDVWQAPAVSIVDRSPIGPERSISGVVLDPKTGKGVPGVGLALSGTRPKGAFLPPGKH